MTIPAEVGPGESDEIARTWGNIFTNLGNRGITYDMILKNPASSMQQSAMDWVRCSVLPEDNVDTPLRYHDATNAYASAALCVVTPYALNWQQQPIAANGANEQLGPSDMGVFSFDDCAFNVLVYYNPNASYRTWKYDWTFNGNTLLKWNENGQLGVNKAMYNSDPNTNWDPHGLYLYCQRDVVGNSFEWIDCLPGAVDANGNARPSKVTMLFPGITLNAQLANYSFEVALYRYFNGTPKRCTWQVVGGPDNNMDDPANTGGIGTLVFDLNINAQTADEFPTFSDYYMFRLARPTTVAADMDATSAIVNAGVNVFHDGVCSVWAHKAVEEVEMFSRFFSDKARINAQGVRLTDVAMLQYINGQIAGATAWSGNSWYNYLQRGLEGGRVFYDQIAEAPGAIVKDLLDGCGFSLVVDFERSAVPLQGMWLCYVRHGQPGACSIHPHGVEMLSNRMLALAATYTTSRPRSPTFVGSSGSPGTSAPRTSRTAGCRSPRTGPSR